MNNPFEEIFKRLENIEKRGGRNRVFRVVRGTFKTMTKEAKRVEHA